MFETYNSQKTVLISLFNMFHMHPSEKNGCHEDSNKLKPIVPLRFPYLIFPSLLELCFSALHWYFSKYLAWSCLCSTLMGLERCRNVNLLMVSHSLVDQDLCTRISPRPNLSKKKIDTKTLSLKLIPGPRHTL